MYAIKEIIIQDEKIKEIILKLQGKAKNIIYGDYSSLESEGAIHLKAKNIEIQCAKSLLMVSLMPYIPRR